MTPTNTARGEVLCRLAGADRRLCLTLGALAELEQAFGADGMSALAERLRSLSARDLITVLAALLRGGGEHETAGRISDIAIDLREAAEAVARTFKAAA